MKIDPDVILASIDANLESLQEEPFRDHLGASLIGRQCEREVWYSFRWATKVLFKGRMLRLFDRGHREEERFEQWMEAICDQFWSIDPRTGKQIRVSDIRGYFGGSLDGVARNPCGYRGDYLTEFKTHSVKSFEKLVLKGVKVSKPEHYVQMQIYLHYNPKLTGALYMAIQKNDDALHIEYIERDEACALANIGKARRVIIADQPPAQFDAASPYNFYCKHFCDYTKVCHEGDAPHVSCRTCFYVETTKHGWYCNHHDKLLDSKDQRKACDSYERGF